MDTTKRLIGAKKKQIGTEAKSEVAKFVNAGVVIDISRTRSDLKGTKQAVEDAIIEAMRKKLNALLYRLKTESSNRQSQLKALGLESHHAEDNPFSGAYVTLTRSGGKRKVTVAHRSERADRNLFNILDQGRKSIHTAKKMAFPEYETKSQRTSTEDFFLSSKKQLTGKLIFTNSVNGFEGRKYYERMAQEVMDEWPGYVEIEINGRKTRVEVNPDEFEFKIV
jgi:hypothetical protein